MKYYLKDKNGIVHTESNEHKFKLALKYKHKKNEQENFAQYGLGGKVGGLQYPADNQYGSITMGTWNIGYPEIHRKYVNNTEAYWAQVSNSNIICYEDILIGNTNLISNRDISNDIIIKYNTNFNKIATYDEMINDYNFGLNNKVLTYNYLRNIDPKTQNTFNLIDYKPGGLLNDTFANCWQVADKITHNTTNLSNKYYTENTVSFTGGAGTHKMDYFTIDVTNDWNTYSKIRLRVKLLVNIQTNNSAVIDVNEMFGDIKNHTNINEYKSKPFIIVARTTNDATLSNETDRDTVEGGLMFYNGSTKGDTITSYDEESCKDDRNNRTYDYTTQKLVDLNTYVSYSDNVYYTYNYRPGETKKYYVTRDEIYNYLKTPNPRFNLMIGSSSNYGELELTAGTDIKDLDESFKTYTSGDENWYETTLNKFNPFKDSDDEYKYTFSESYYGSDCYNIFVEGYFDIKVSELKRYLHIGFPFITGLYGNADLYNTTTVSNLEMSVEGVN